MMRKLIIYSREIFHLPKRPVSKVLLSSAKMAIATFSSRILGLVREQIMAASFGASGVTDAFLIAY